MGLFGSQGGGTGPKMHRALLERCTAVDHSACVQREMESSLFSTVLSADVFFPLCTVNESSIRKQLLELLENGEESSQRSGFI